MNQVLKTIHNDFFESMEVFLHNSISNIKAKNYPNNDDIQIFIPSYIVRMFNEYLSQTLYKYHFPEINKFMGVTILDNWDNSIIVRHKDSLLYPELKTFKLDIK